MAAPGEQALSTNPIPATGDLKLSYPFMGAALPLRTYVPIFYNSLKRYPLVVAINGGGVDENSYFDSYDQGRMKEVAERCEAIVICPRRLGANPTAEAKSLQSAIDLISSRYSIDPLRVYLMGHSAGGALALYLAASSDLPIAAVASLAGPIPPKYRANWPRIQVPVFLAAAEGDDIVPISQMLATRDLLIETGTNMEFKLLDAKDHNQWIAPLFDEIFTWFLSHRKVSDEKASSSGLTE